jgi:hypothetical protein
MTAAFSATVMVHSCVGVGLTAGHFVPRLRGNDEELRNSGDSGITPEIGFACNVGFVLRFCALGSGPLKATFAASKWQRYRSHFGVLRI